MTTWPVELSKFSFNYEPRGVIKSKALVDFIVEMILVPKVDSWWILYVDGSSNLKGRGAVMSGLQIICMQLLGMSSPWTRRPLSDQGTTNRRISLALLHLGDGHLKLISHGQRASQVLTGRGRLLHQMDQGRTVSNHQGPESPEIWTFPLSGDRQ
ncbi:hypothetical protein CR513_00051, partial [Mucuna pruriens]